MLLPVMGLAGAQDKHPSPMQRPGTFSLLSSKSPVSEKQNWPRSPWQSRPAIRHLLQGTATQQTALSRWTRFQAKKRPKKSSDKEDFTYRDDETDHSEYLNPAAYAALTLCFCLLTPDPFPNRPHFSISQNFVLFIKVVFPQFPQ